ncbi:MAG: ZIP family metal transporter [Bacilli bacterium]
MNNVSFSFLLTTLAGLSTMLGTIIIFIKKKNYQKIILSSLSFAAGVMITVSITDLIPESIAILRDNLQGISVIIISFLGIVLGATISMIIDYYFPNNLSNNNKDNTLYKVGIISMIAIIMHNIPEGIATFIATNSNTSLGISLFIAIAMHNIPEGISISVPIYYSTGSKKTAIKYTLISALSEPFGALLAFIFLRNIVNNLILGILFSTIAGIMLQISFCELLPAARKYKNTKYTIIFFIIGVIFMLLKFII